MIVWFTANYGMKRMKKEDWFYITIIIYFLKKFLFFIPLIFSLLSNWTLGLDLPMFVFNSLDRIYSFFNFIDDNINTVLCLFLTFALVQNKLIDWWYVMRFVIALFVLILIINLTVSLIIKAITDYESIESKNNIEKMNYNSKKESMFDTDYIWNTVDDDEFMKKYEEKYSSWSVESKRKSSSLFENSQSAEKLSTKFDYEDPFSDYSSNTKTESEKSSSKTLDSEEETTIKNNSGTTEDEEKAKRAERIKEILKKKRAEKEKAENWN